MTYGNKIEKASQENSIGRDQPEIRGLPEGLECEAKA
jgi:hypothetical protein